MFPLPIHPIRPSTGARCRCRPQPSRVAVAQEIADKQEQTGIIPPNQRPAAESLQKLINSDEDLKAYRKMRQAYGSFMACYNNPGWAGSATWRCPAG